MPRINHLTLIQALTVPQSIWAYEITQDNSISAHEGHDPERFQRKQQGFHFSEKKS